MKMKKQTSLFFLMILLFVSILFLTNLSATADGISNEVEQSAIAANASTVPAQNSSRVRSNKKRTLREPHRTTGTVLSSRMARIFGATNLDAPDYAFGKTVEIPTMAKTVNGYPNGSSLNINQIYTGSSESLDRNIVAPYIGANGYELDWENAHGLYQDFAATVYPYLLHDFHDFLAEEVKADKGTGLTPSGIPMSSGLKNPSLDPSGSGNFSYYDALSNWLDTPNHETTIAFPFDLMHIGDSRDSASITDPGLGESYPIPYAYWESFMDPNNVNLTGAFWREYPRYYCWVYLPMITSMYHAYYGTPDASQPAGFPLTGEVLRELGYYVPEKWRHFGMSGMWIDWGWTDIDNYDSNDAPGMAIPNMAADRVVVLDTTMPRNVYADRDIKYSFYPDNHGQNWFFLDERLSNPWYPPGGERDITGYGDFPSVVAQDPTKDYLVRRSSVGYDLQFILGHVSAGRLAITGPSGVLDRVQERDEWLGVDYVVPGFKGSYKDDVARQDEGFTFEAKHIIASDAYPYLYKDLKSIELTSHNGSYDFVGFYNHKNNSSSPNTASDIGRLTDGSEIELKIKTKGNYENYTLQEEKTMAHPLGMNAGMKDANGVWLTLTGYGGRISAESGLDADHIAELRVADNIDRFGGFQPTRKDVLQQFGALRKDRINTGLTVEIDPLTHSTLVGGATSEFADDVAQYKIETELALYHWDKKNTYSTDEIPLPEGVTRLMLGEISVEEENRVAPLRITFKKGQAGANKLNLGASIGHEKFVFHESDRYTNFDGFLVSVPDGEIIVEDEVMFDRSDSSIITANDKVDGQGYYGNQIFGVMASDFLKNNAANSTDETRVKLTPLRLYSEHNDLQLGIAYAVDKVDQSTYATQKGVQVVRLQGDYTKVTESSVVTDTSTPGSPVESPTQQGFESISGAAAGYGNSSETDVSDVANHPNSVTVLGAADALKYGEIAYVDTYEYQDTGVTIEPHIQHLSIAATSGTSANPLAAVGVKYSFAKTISVEGVADTAPLALAPDETNLRVAISPVTEELWIVDEYVNGISTAHSVDEIKIDTAGKDKNVAGTVDLKTVRLLGKYKNPEPHFMDNVYHDMSKYEATPSAKLGTTMKLNFSVVTSSSDTMFTERSGPVQGRWQLTQLPEIFGWNKADIPNATLSLNGNQLSKITHEEFGANALDDIKILEVQDQGNMLEILDLSQIQGETKLEEVLYRYGNEDSLKYLDFSNMQTLDAHMTFHKTGKAPVVAAPSDEQKAEEGATLRVLETLKLNNLPQIGINNGKGSPLTIDYSDNKIRLFEMKDADQDVVAGDRTKLAGLNLSGNQLNQVETVAGTPHVTGSEMTLDGSSVDGTLDLSRNILDQAWFDGIEIKHLDVSEQKERPIHAITELPYMKNGVKLNNANIAETVTFGGMHLGNLILNNSPNILTLNGAKYHADPSYSGNLGIIGGTLGLEGNTVITELKLYGHLIEVAELSTTNLTEINLAYNNGKGEDRAFDTATLEEKLDPANQGVLRRVDLKESRKPISKIDVRYNVIEYIDNQGKAPSPRAVGDPHAIDLKGAVMAPNAGIDADFNNIDGVFLLGLDNLTTLHLTDNLLVTLQASGLKNLRNLYANRTMAGRNLFENGIVDLSNSTALESFAPSTTLAADKAESLKQNRQVPKEPNETRWEITANPALGIYDAEWRQDDYKPTTEFGFYHNVPIKELNVTGAKSLKTLRVAGNRLTNATMKVDASASSLELLDISGAPYLENGENAPRTARTRFGMAITKRKGKQDARSGKITGNFAGVWPNLKTLYVQNNALSSVQVGSSAQLKILLAYQNNITKVELMSAPNLEILDIERNLLGALEVPQRMRILRAGENKLTSYPNVANIATLEQLYVNHNLLRGTAPSIAGNPVLKVLNLAENGFASFPDLAEHGALEEFYAYNNHASSSTRFNPAGKLAIVDLAGNRLNSIAELANSIVYFDISDNRFVGQLTFPDAIPAGFSRVTGYPVIAHEVYSRDTKNDGAFTGALAIENNQITSLPTGLENAWAQFRAGTVGRPVYNLFLDFNVLDIDVYGLRGELDENGQIKRFTGTQKWVVMDPDNLPRLLVTATNSDLYLALGDNVKLYNPAIAGTVDSLVPKTRMLKTGAQEAAPPVNAAAYETPFPGQRYETGWYGDGWQDFVTNGNNRVIKQTGFALAKITILPSPGRNGYDIGAVHLIDWQTVDTTMEPGQITAPGGTDSGTATDGKKKGKNPNTGGK